MNKKNIGLFNYVYSSTFETEKDDNLKWSEFNKICLEKMNYVPYDFISDNKNLVNIDKSIIKEYITGEKYTGGKFVILNFWGQKEFLNYKVNEIKAVISNYGNDAFNNLENIFENMCNEAIREILNECRKIGLIEFDDNKTFMYASDRLYNIFYDNIRVIINKQDNNLYGNIYITNSGQLVNQLGNNNVANISKVNDEQLFLLLNEKLEALKMELQNKNCEEKLKKLEEAMNKKDKKKVLSILSELASIGSFIASMIMNVSNI